MFRENKEHLNKSMFCTIDSMDPRYAKEIEEGWAGLFYKHVFCSIDEKLFEPLYSKDMGRPNTPVNILVGLEIIKHTWNYTDEQLFGALCSDYKVNYALGIRELGSFYVGDRTVYDFRKRLLAYTLSNPEKGTIIFQLFKELTDNFANLLGISKQELRMDSTMIEPNIKKAGRLALAFDVLRQAVKVIPNAKRTDSLNEVLEPRFKTRILYRVESEKLTSNLDYLLQLADQSLKIANRLPEVAVTEEIKILMRFLEEQTIFDEKRKKLKAKQAFTISANSLQSAYDPDATYRDKRGKKSSGYSVNVTETCGEDNPIQLIVDYMVEKNTISDTEFLKKALPNIDKKTTVYLDGGYSSTELWQEAKSKNVDLMFTDMTGSKPDPDKLPLSSFDVVTKENEETILSCPAGHKPLYCYFNEDSYSARFDIHICEACPMNSQCPTKLKKRYGILKFSKKSYITSLVRAECFDREVLLKSLSKRAGVEGCISGLKLGQELAQLPVRGKLKIDYYTELKMIAANVKRLIRGVKIMLEKGIPIHQGRSAPIYST
ncbi:MAG: transposase [Firmicutes bacterium]|nr:transposase [Bacillota bacterium]